MGPVEQSYATVMGITKCYIIPIPWKDPNPIIIIYVAREKTKKAPYVNEPKGPVLNTNSFFVIVPYTYNQSKFFSNIFANVKLDSFGNLELHAC